jgi:RNA 2',3'-cyclic 3'-phosphodiesterase
MRLFVAAAVPPIALEGARLGGPESPAHLTVLFLGEVAEARVREIADRFVAVVRVEPPFPLELAGVGMFPDATRPRVVWVGVGAGASELGVLHDRLVRAARELQLPVDDRPFVPHLTLRRIRGPREAELARQWTTELGAKTFGRTEVTELELKESLLGNGPVVHRTIVRLPLGGPVSTR